MRRRSQAKSKLRLYFWRIVANQWTQTDSTTGKELPGAHLKVTIRNTVDEWTSTEESYVIKELVVGGEYTMIETKTGRWDMKHQAESITFTVENTAEIQKVEMKDDVTKSADQ